MAYQYAVDPARRLVEIRFEGTLSPADIAGLRAETVADEAFDPSCNQLINGSRITHLENVGTHTVEKLAAQRTDVCVPGARRAIIAPTDLGYGLSRVFQALADSDDVQVFRDYDAALPWLEGE